MVVQDWLYAYVYPLLPQGIIWQDIPSLFTPSKCTSSCKNKPIFVHLYTYFTLFH